MPLISACVACLQILFLFCFKSYALWGIFFANSLAFLLYALICYVVSLKIYPHEIIHRETTWKLLSLFCLFIAIIHAFVTSHYTPSFVMTMLMGLSCTWPIVVWFFIIDEHEKKWVMAQLNMRLQVRRVNG